MTTTPTVLERLGELEKTLAPAELERRYGARVQASVPTWLHRLASASITPAEREPFRDLVVELTGDDELFSLMEETLRLRREKADHEGQAHIQRERPELAAIRAVVESSPSLGALHMLRARLRSLEARDRNFWIHGMRWTSSEVMGELFALRDEIDDVRAVVDQLIAAEDHAFRNRRESRPAEPTPCRLLVRSTRPRERRRSVRVRTARGSPARPEPDPASRRTVEHLHPVVLHRRGVVA